METAAYNNRLQPCRKNTNSTSSFTLTQCTDGPPSANVLDFTYGYNSAANNGNIASWSATGQQAFNRTYIYDSLNRLSTLSSPSDPHGCTGLSWTVDAWGNRTDQTVTGASCYSFHSTVGTNNRLGSPYQYDAAGNMTYDGSLQYYYDAENRIIQLGGTLGNCSSATACYAYDANGARARKTEQSGFIEYIRDLQGNVVGEWSPTLGWNRGYVYVGSDQLAEYGDATTYFIFRDHLGSTRLMTATNQFVHDSMDYLPFRRTTRRWHWFLSQIHRQRTRPRIRPRRIWRTLLFVKPRAIHHSQLGCQRRGRALRRLRQPAEP